LGSKSRPRGSRLGMTDVPQKETRCDRGQLGQVKRKTRNTKLAKQGRRPKKSRERQANGQKNGKVGRREPAFLNAQRRKTLRRWNRKGRQSK